MQNQLLPNVDFNPNNIQKDNLNDLKRFLETASTQHVVNCIAAFGAGCRPGLAPPNVV